MGLKSFRYPACLAFCVALLSSCTKPSTVVTQEFTFQSGSARPDVAYRAIVTCEGEAGKAYVERSVKRVNLFLFDGTNVLANASFSVVAADLECEHDWRTWDLIKFRFFEKTPGGANTFLKQIAFKADSNSGRFREERDPNR